MLFTERFKKATDGKVIIEINAMSPITNPRDAHEAVAAGLVDMALCMTDVSPGRYPFLDCVALSARGYTSSEMASMGTAHLIKMFPIIEKRMGNFKIIEVTGIDIGR